MDDVEIVAVQLGRRPRGTVRVSARCPFGLPLAIRTEPMLEDGEPFPTLYWLTCPAATRACGMLESSGRMRELNERLAGDAELRDAYRRAYEAYVADRDGALARPGAPGAGGMPDRVKCVHALVAHDASTGANPIGAIVRSGIEPLDCPGPCVVETDSGASPAPQHPHMRGKR